MDQDPAVKLFDSEDFDLYNALGLDNAATEEAIKKAYRRLALQFHPDKLSNKADDEREAATRKFQQIGYAYAVLSDGDRKKRYDTTGRTDESLLDGSGDWNEYFKELWQGEVNASTIEEFYKSYQDSQEELDDLKAAYNDSKGEIEHILAHCMAADALAAEERFTFLINSAIERGELKSTKAWKKSLKDTKAREKRRQAAESEAQEAEAMAKELGVHDKLFGGSKKKGKKEKAAEEEVDEDALRALIQQRGKKRMEESISALEAKYAAIEEEAAAKKSKSKKRASEPEEELEAGASKKRRKGKKENMPTEEEFEAIQARLQAGKGKTVDKKSKPKK